MNATQQADATAKGAQPAVANIQTMIGLALEPYTMLFGETAWLGPGQGPSSPDLFSDSMYMNVEWALVEGWLEFVLFRSCAILQLVLAS